MGKPILPPRFINARQSLADILEEIEYRFGVSDPPASTRKRLAKSWLYTGDDHALPETEAAYRDGYAEGASLALRCRGLRHNIDPLIDEIYLERLYYRRLAESRRTPERTRRQAVYRGMHQGLVQSKKCRNEDHIHDWIDLIEPWEKSELDWDCPPPKPPKATEASR